MWTLLRSAAARARARRVRRCRSYATGASTSSTWTSSVTRALDGHIFCNREKLAYWTAPLAGAAAGSICFRRRCRRVPRQRSPEARVHERTCCPNASRPGPASCTRCASAGPSGIDYLAARASAGSTSTSTATRVDDVYRMIARDLSFAQRAQGGARILRRFLHVHPSLQTGGCAVERGAPREGRRWVEGVLPVRRRLVLRRQSAAVGAARRPARDPEPDRPPISSPASRSSADRRPGYYRYDELARLGVEPRSRGRRLGRTATLPRSRGPDRGKSAVPTP